MKIVNILGSIALSILVMTSCAVHDPIDDNGELGQVLPTVDWEQSSKFVKAGNYATFKGKYYTTSDKQIDHSEVWALVKREQSAAAKSMTVEMGDVTSVYGKDGQPVQDVTEPATSAELVEQPATDAPIAPRGQQITTTVPTTENADNAEETDEAEEEEIVD